MFASLSVGKRSIVMRVFVWPLAHLTDRLSKLHQMFNARTYLWPWLGLHLAALRYVMMYFRFCGWHYVCP